MKAMILAAGVGSRLRPITDTRPKALVKVGGVPMLEIVLRRLMAAGVDGVIVNVHHFPEQIEAFLKERGNFGIRVELSREPELLDTGGGLKKASWFFDDGKPFFLHNVDAYTELDLAKMYAAHLAGGALATLAVAKRESGRYLLFDKDGRLRGRESAKGVEWAGAQVEAPEKLAFNIVHVISPALFPKLTETGFFSIIDAYLRLAAQGERIQSFRADPYYWRDIGTPETLAKARRRS
ncbi:MAG: nucleotidyltransferase family protein [Elusimicrobia bacterium]|nr:nucleotidyltransferase family protein [Elusimicrobiota bacterium]